MGKRNRNRKSGNNRQNQNNKVEKEFDKQNNSSTTNSKTSGETRHIHGRDEERGGNDVNWYKHIYTVSEPLARVSFNIMTGSHYNPLNATEVNPYSGEGGWAVESEDIATVDPGILALNVQPVLGDPEAANIAATQLYTLVRQANSGAKNYDKTDLMMMVMAMDSAYMVYEYLLRAFRICKSWDYLNRYTPEALLRAMGFDSGIMTELANFEATLNLFAYRLAALCVPDQFDFIHRHSWLFSNIYEDENNGRAQMYILNPIRIYIWTEGEDDEPTKLVARKITDLYTHISEADPRIHSIKQVQEIIDNVLTPLFGSEDVGLMNGDIVKAFGDGGMIKINAVDTTALAPVHNEEVLEQIMNADILGTDVVTYDNLNIEQDLSSLAAGPQLTQSITFNSPDFVTPRNAVKSLLNMYDDISSDRIITSSRLKFTLGFTPGTSAENPNKEEITSCGTEFIESAIMYYRAPNGYIAPMPFNPRPYMNLQGAQMIGLASKFKYHPTMYLFYMGNNKWYYSGYVQDASTTAWLTDEWIEKMNEAAILSEYAVKDYKTGLS